MRRTVTGRDRLRGLRALLWEWGLHEHCEEAGLRGRECSRRGTRRVRIERIQNVWRRWCWRCRRTLRSLGLLRRRRRWWRTPDARSYAVRKERDGRHHRGEQGLNRSRVIIRRSRHGSAPKASGNRKMCSAGDHWQKRKTRYRWSRNGQRYDHTREDVTGCLLPTVEDMSLEVACEEAMELPRLGCDCR